MANSADPDQFTLFAKEGYIWVQQDIRVKVFGLLNQKQYFFSFTS